MKTFIVHLTIFSMLASSTGSAYGAQQPSAPAAAPRAAPADGAAETVPRDGGWPRSYVSGTGARIVLYQPQVGSWPDQKHMTMYAAASYLPRDAQAQLLGSLQIESDTSVALANRLVSFSEFTITGSSFPTAPKEEVGAIVADIIATIPREHRVIGLDRVLANVDTSVVTPKNTEGVKADPPPIFFSDKSAVLVNLDGPPIWSPIGGTDLRFAVNTNWDLFDYREGNMVYLRDEKMWLTASSVNGPWARALKLPGSFSKLPDNENWTAARAALTPDATGKAPVVFVSTTPAELLLVDGAPKYLPVAGTGLMWISNTEDDVFRAGVTGTVYYLVSGRWFSAPNFSGPWTFATPTLPADFRKIPLNHPRSRVLASVPGTAQALEAVLLSQIPQTARVDRKTISPPTVSYEGDPVFEPIASTMVSRAMNTDKDVLKVGDQYYLCLDAVWFMASTPTGPWVLADSVPGAIYEIPISSPAHNVTYVTVENSNDDYVDYVAAAGYTGMMVAWGCAMWGSGWYYPPYYAAGAFYPTYFGAYPSYGYGARYNPWTGSFARGGAVYGPYGGAGYGARYNPATGTWARGAAAYGPAGARGGIQAYNPRTGAAGRTVQGSNAFGSWGSTAVRRGDQWAQTSRVTRNATGTTGRVTQGSGGGGAVSARGAQGSGFVGRSGGGDVYAGRDGNVYRNNGGSWQKYGDGGWSSADRPVGTAGQTLSGNRDTINQLNRDRGARLDGAQRTRDLGRSGRVGGGSYRPSGGFRGGGGGFRGGGGGFRGGGRR